MHRRPLFRERVERLRDAMERLLGVRQARRGERA
jgi:hypothetical protein